MGIPITQIDGERLIEKLIPADHAGPVATVVVRRGADPSRRPTLTAPERETLRARLGNARGPVDLRGRLTADR